MVGFLILPPYSIAEKYIEPEIMAEEGEFHESEESEENA